MYEKVFLLAVLAFPMSAQSEPLVVPLPNGDFENGLAGWTVETATGGFGAHTANGQVDLVDLAPFGGTGRGACLSVYAASEWTEAFPAGSAAQAQVVLARDARVGARYLRFSIFGNWTTAMFHTLEVKAHARVTVTGTRGERVEAVIAEDGSVAPYDCGTGVAGAAVFVPSQSIDLYAGGFRAGDPIRIEIVWSTSSVALDRCDSGDIGGGLCIDDVEFVGSPLAPAPGPPRTLRRFLPLRTPSETSSALRPPLLPLPFPLSRP